MERLTRVDGIGQNEIIKCFGCDLENAGAELEHCGYCEHWQAVVNRLAAYEDTGLTPEEIITGEELAEISSVLLLLLQYQALGAIEELTALVKARDEGRVVVLPCKVGDTVYWMWPDGEGGCDGPIYEACVYGICVTKNGIELYRDPCDSGFGMIGIHPNRAIFLTRAEAEAALEGGVQP